MQGMARESVKSGGASNELVIQRAAAPLSLDLSLPLRRTPCPSKVDDKREPSPSFLCSYVQ